MDSTREQKCALLCVLQLTLVLEKRLPYCIFVGRKERVCLQTSESPVRNRILFTLCSKVHSMVTEVKEASNYIPRVLNWLPFLEVNEMNFTIVSLNCLNSF